MDTSWIDDLAAVAAFVVLVILAMAGYSLLALAAGYR